MIQVSCLIIYNTPTRQIQEVDLITVVLGVAPVKYKATLTSEQRMRDSKLMNQHFTHSY